MEYGIDCKLNLGGGGSKTKEKSEEIELPKAR